jgi:hypothetical protein
MLGTGGMATVYAAVDESRTDGVGTKQRAIKSPALQTTRRPQV